MVITKNTPIHYFIKDESCDDWHKIELESYLEVPQGNGTSNFSRLEDISLFISKDLNNHEVVAFRFDGGRNDCMRHWAKNLKDLVSTKEADASICRFKKADQKSYLKMRDLAFDIYLKHPKTDYNRLKIGSEY